MSELKTTTRLTGDKADFVTRLKQPDTDEAIALHELTGVANLETVPNTTLVNSVIEAGIQAIRAKAEEVGQARLVEFLQGDEEHKAWRESRRRRRMRNLEGMA